MLKRQKNLIPFKVVIPLMSVYQSLLTKIIRLSKLNLLTKIEIFETLFNRLISSFSDNDTAIPEIIMLSQ